MSVITEIEIKAMTKVENYLRGYRNGESDVLDKIRAEIDRIEIWGQINESTMFIRSGTEVKKMALDIIDKYKAESEDKK